MTPNTLHCGDCLDVVRSWATECIGLIYLDPPYNSNRHYGAFDDRWKWEDCEQDFQESVQHESLTDCMNALRLMLKEGKKLAYLSYMANRLKALHGLLKPTGSLYLHCDPTASHYLKIVMDAVFGEKNFRNEIVWCYTGPTCRTMNFPRKHDIILRYSKGDTWIFNGDYISYGDDFVKKCTRTFGHKYGSGEITKLKEIEIRGKLVEDWWADLTPITRLQNEQCGFPTQKPIHLLERIIKASSNENDLVLDPFCGSGTTLVAAKSLNRQYVGIDANPDAIEISAKRLKKTHTQLNLVA